MNDSIVLKFVSCDFVIDITIHKTLSTKNTKCCHDIIGLCFGICFHDTIPVFVFQNLFY